MRRPSSVISSVIWSLSGSSSGNWAIISGNVLFNLLQGADLAGQVRGEGDGVCSSWLWPGVGMAPPMSLCFHESLGMRQQSGVLKILGDVLADGLTLAHNPENNEQGQHGGDKIRVGHLPGPAVGPAVADLSF